MKRFVALWLPLFATDRLTRPGKALAEWRELPLATIGRAQGGLRVVAANGPARRAGVAAALSAADANALCPGLKSVEADSDGDGLALAGLAEWCQRWSPWTAPADEGDFTIWIEVAGSAHLFGGEADLLEQIRERIGGLGFSLRLGLADTPGAAWAASRFGSNDTNLLPEGSARQLLGGFPVAALRLPAATIETLRRLGLRRISDLLALPRAPLAARFGPRVALRLDQLLGRLPEALAPQVAEEPLLARLAFAEPIGRDEDVAAATLSLLGEMEGLLERRGLGARRLVLTVFRVDGDVLAQSIGTQRPVRAAPHLARLFAEGRDGLDAGFGIEAMSLAVTEADLLESDQSDLEAPPRGPTLPLLLDRLTRRLGDNAVFRPIPLASYWPDRAWGRAAPLKAVSGVWPALKRPLRLPRPRPIPVTAEDCVPQFLGRVALPEAKGPERIAAEWWRCEQGHRDYWRVEDVDGRRLWLFQDDRGRWFAQGGFG